MSTPRNTTSANDLKSAKARERLDARGKPYFTLIGDCSYLGYRRNAKKGGVWVARYEKKGRDAFQKKIALADDGHAQAAPPEVLTYAQAVKAAQETIDEHLKRPPRDPNGGGGGSGPKTVREAVAVDYSADLRRRGSKQANARALLCRLGPGTIGDTDVRVLTKDDLDRWYDSLINGTAPKIRKGKAKLTIGSVNRLCSNLRRALWLVARKKFDEISEGVKKRSAAGEDENVILAEQAVVRFVGAALKHERKLGVFVATVAGTGSRPSQCARLRVCDLDDNATKPMLNMPKSGKGKAEYRHRRNERQWIAITPELAAMLREEAAGRPHDAPLLMQKTGEPWTEEDSEHSPARFYGRPVRAVVASLDLKPRVDILSDHQPADVSIYALRHSSIVYMLLKGLPVSVVAKHHDTSAMMIERNYSLGILRPADDMTRSALMSIAPASNVVSLNRKRKERDNGRSTERVNPRHPATKATVSAKDQRQGLSRPVVRRVARR